MQSRRRHSTLRHKQQTHGPLLLHGWPSIPGAARTSVSGKPMAEIAGPWSRGFGLGAEARAPVEEGSLSVSRSPTPWRVWFDTRCSRCGRCGRCDRRGRCWCSSAGTCCAHATPSTSTPAYKHTPARAPLFAWAPLCLPHRQPFAMSHNTPAQPFVSDASHDRTPPFLVTTRPRACRHTGPRHPPKMHAAP